MTDDPRCPNCGLENPAVLYDDQSDRDASEVDDVDEAAACDQCYENVDCPHACNEPHDPPDPDGEGQWQCPTSEQWYRATGDECDPDWTACDLSEESVLVMGYWHDREDTFECPGCDYRYHDDDGYYSESRGETYCESCYPSDGTGEHADGSRYSTCTHCHQNVLALSCVVHFDPDTEQTWCSNCGPIHGVPELAVAA